MAGDRADVQRAGGAVHHRQAVQQEAAGQRAEHEVLHRRLGGRIHVVARARPARTATATSARGRGRPPGSCWPRHHHEMPAANMASVIPLALAASRPRRRRARVGQRSPRSPPARRSRPAGGPSGRLTTMPLQAVGGLARRRIGAGVAATTASGPASAGGRWACAGVTNRSATSDHAGRTSSHDLRGDAIQFTRSCCLVRLTAAWRRDVREQFRHRGVHHVGEGLGIQAHPQHGDAASTGHHQELAAFRCR